MHGKKKIPLILNCVFVLLFTAALQAQEMPEAEVYLQGSNKEILLFTFKQSEEHSGNERIWTQYYYQPDGTLFATDQLILDAKENWHTHKTAFPLLNEHSVMERKGNKVDFLFARDGKERTRTRNVETPIVFGPTQQRFLYQIKDRLLKGEVISLYTPAPEFTRLIEFRVQRIYDSPYERPGAVVAEMSTQNPIISWFLGKSHYVADIETGRILEIHGASILKREVNGKWEYVNVEMYYTYPEQKK
ncbi:MAG: hypothetical protein K0B52_06485 [FCB group bacterium]|nr:hypothetical protein [FCB group bacterium]